MGNDNLVRLEMNVIMDCGFNNAVDDGYGCRILAIIS
jgi:hypothetical protein